MPEWNEGAPRLSNPPGPADDPVGAEIGASVPSTAGTSPMLDGIRLGIEAETARSHGETRRLAVNILAGGGANLVKIVLQLVMLPLMARLLGPTEFAVYALALPTVAFFITLADGGLGASIAREPLEARDIWSTAFWLMLMVGVALTVMMIGWGFVMARLALEPRVAGVTALLSVSFLLVVCSVLPSARLMQERRLAAISAADLAGAVSGAVLAVALALSGAGAMSLAAQYVATYLVRAIALNLIAFVRPYPIFKLSALTSHISTGSSLIAGRLAEFAGRLTENLVFGRLFGPASLGTFTFANQVPRFICEAASGPVWGALYAHTLRSSGDEVRHLHAKLMHLLALVLAPIAFLGAVTVPNLVHLILGPAWQDSAPVLSVLLPFYALNVVATLGGAILLARGAGWTIFWLLLFLVVTRIAAVLPGPWIGPVAVAWGIGLAQILYTGLTLAALRRIGMPAGHALLSGILAPTVAGLLAGLACYLIVRSAPDDPLRIALALLTGALAYLALLLLMEGRRLWADFGGMVRLIRP